MSFKTPGRRSGTEKDFVAVIRVNPSLPESSGSLASHPASTKSVIRNCSERDSIFSTAATAFSSKATITATSPDPSGSTSMTTVVSTRQADNKPKRSISDRDAGTKRFIITYARRQKSSCVDTI